MTRTARLLNIEEYARLPDDGRPTELVRGKVVTMNVSAPRHGQICVNIVRILGHFLDQHDLGILVSNDSGVVTERNPDTLRGTDVAFYSYARAPKGPLPKGYLPVAPELVFEVLSPDDRWPNVLAKIAEYLGAGVDRVCVLDPQRQTVTVYCQDQPEQRLATEQELSFPQLLPGFAVSVQRFFG